MSAPAPYYSDDLVTIYHGDCRDVLPGLGPFETCITDPPYGLSFMGKDWDHGVPGVHFWELVSGALLPGAPLLAFGGTRTFHRLTCAIEDAGFEVRDCLMWMYGTGFPKALDISKAIDKAAGAEREVGPANQWAHVMGDAPKDATAQVYGDGQTDKRTDDPPATNAAKLWDGWASCLKPAWEPIVLAMKPLDGTFAENALEHGVAGLNIDGSRLGTDEIVTHRPRADGDDKVYGKYCGGDPTAHSGRWPANVVLDEDAAAMLDEASGTLSSGSRAAGVRSGMGFHGANGDGGPEIVGDSGGASRFFYTSKASRADRGEGNDHPTVKPSDLMTWLCMLTKTPTGGVVLDPFMGSGSTLVAAREAGRKSVGIEKKERYCEIARKRLAQQRLPV